MKILANYGVRDYIPFLCDYCGCLYRVDDPDDWTLSYNKIKGVKNRIPEYSVTCPNCGHKHVLGYDKDDVQGTAYGVYDFPKMDAIKARTKWAEMRAPAQPLD